MRKTVVFVAVSICCFVLPPKPAVAYPWPVKPFVRQHPIRGNFGDPRTIFDGPPTEHTLFAAPGQFAFHTGVDIVAPGGTPVFPVESGVVASVTSSVVTVSSGPVQFEFWHIDPRVFGGEAVAAGETVLGTIQSRAGHVHLTEIDDGSKVNPLAIGHLTPYSDTVRPTTSAILFRRPGPLQEIVPPLISGRVELVAAAHDEQSLPVGGPWGGLPLTPALVTWSIRHWDGKVVVPTTVATDFRSTIPPNVLFWSTYARGTFQNMSVFGTREAWLQPGMYLFRLTPEPFDTHRLADGYYDITVTATDIRGNSGSFSQRFTVLNYPQFTGHPRKDGWRLLPP